MAVARKVIVVVLAILAVVAGVLACAVYRDREGSTPPVAEARPLSICFVGNSFTFVNDLPAMLKGLAASDGISVTTKQHTPGGAQLVHQADNPDVQQMLKEHWDYVVIQEQSQLPAIEHQRRTSTEPALRALMGLAAQSGSPTVLYETWGYKNGDGDNVKDDSYTAMQNRLDDGFAKLHAATGIEEVQVNRAWRRARETHPEIELWGPDAKHPAPAGTYLAACVFYNTMLKRSPKGNKFTAGLATAATLQEIAISL